VFTEGDAAHAALQFNARCYFFIYLDIVERLWPKMIDSAVGKDAHRFSVQYDEACTRLHEWRKKWWSRLMATAKEMQRRLMEENKWQNIPEDHLLDV